MWKTMNWREKRRHKANKKLSKNFIIKVVFQSVSITDETNDFLEIF